MHTLIFDVEIGTNNAVAIVLPYRNLEQIQKDNFFKLLKKSLS